VSVENFYKRSDRALLCSFPLNWIAPLFPIVMPYSL
jgi:hypothetical protein